MRPSAITIFVWIGLSGAVAGTALAQTTPPNVDNRKAVFVSETIRVFILAEMRNMLAATQGVAEAIGKNDWPAAAKAAERSGLKVFKSMPKPLMMQLPPDFRAFGKTSHMGFDAVADATKSKPDATIVSAKLGEALAVCVACHQTYRLVVKP